MTLFANHTLGVSITLLSGCDGCKNHLEMTMLEWKAVITGSPDAAAGGAVDPDAIDPGHPLRLRFVPK